MLRPVGEIRTELEGKAPVDERIAIGLGHAAGHVITEPIFQVVDRLKERLDDIDGGVRAARSPAVDGPHIIKTALHTPPLRFPIMAEHNLTLALNASPSQHEIMSETSAAARASVLNL